MATWKLSCQCGWQTTGSETEVVESAREHGRDLHNMDVTHEQAMAMATEIEE